MYICDAHCFNCVSHCVSIFLSYLFPLKIILRIINEIISIAKIFSISIQDEFRLRTMIFSLNKEIQAPSIYLIDNHIFFTSTPHKFHTLLSLYYVQPCKNQKKHNSLSLVAKRSKNHHRTNHLLMFTESHQKLSSSCKKKKKKPRHERSITPVVSEESVDSR